MLNVGVVINLHLEISSNSFKLMTLKNKNKQSNVIGGTTKGLELGISYSGF